MQEQEQEVQRLLLDAVYLLMARVPEELSKEEEAAWRTRWRLHSAGAYTHH